MFWGHRVYSVGDRQPLIYMRDFKVRNYCCYLWGRHITYTDKVNVKIIQIIECWHK